MHWFFTALLIAASAGTVAFAGYLLRRLFTTEPGVPEITDVTDVTDVTAEPAP